MNYCDYSSTTNRCRRSSRATQSLRCVNPAPGRGIKCKRSTTTPPLTTALRLQNVLDMPYLTKSKGGLDVGGIRQACINMGLRDSGTRSTLVDRIRMYLATPGPPTPGPPTPAPAATPGVSVQVRTFPSNVPLYNRSPRAPLFRNIKGLHSIMYYDLKIKNKRKRILFLSEWHEFTDGFAKINRYIGALNRWIQSQPGPKHCLDIHTEIPREWTPITNPNYLGMGRHVRNHVGGQSTLGTMGSVLTDQPMHFGQGVRYHTDDLRSYGLFGSGSNQMTRIRVMYDHRLFNFNTEEILALSFGVGMICDINGNILPAYKHGLKTRWMAVPHHQRGPPLDNWVALTRARKRGLKSMRLFLKEYDVPLSKLLKVMSDTIDISGRGISIYGRSGGNFGWEAVNDMYSFFRMFRTFPNKRSYPCQDGYQHNIIYISHLSHSLKIMYMMKALFGIKKPAHSESIDDIIRKPALSGGVIKAWEQVTDNLSTVKRNWARRVTPIVRDNGQFSATAMNNMPLLGDTHTPRFFA